MGEDGTGDQYLVTDQDLLLIQRSNLLVGVSYPMDGDDKEPLFVMKLTGDDGEELATFAFEPEAMLYLLRGAIAWMSARKGYEEVAE